MERYVNINNKVVGLKTERKHEEKKVEDFITVRKDKKRMNIHNVRTVKKKMEW